MRRESLINIGFCVVFLLLAIFIFGYLKSTKAKLKKRSGGSTDISSKNISS